MSVEQLWLLRKQLKELLRRKITQDMRELERRLACLHGDLLAENLRSNTKRRPYAKVLRKYRNPDEPTETWSGRGKRPKWVVALLRAGKTLKDMAVGADTIAKVSCAGLVGGGVA